MYINICYSNCPTPTGPLPPCVGSLSEIESMRMNKWAISSFLQGDFLIQFHIKSVLFVCATSHLN